MEFHLTLTFGWPWIAFAASLVWLTLVVPIGNVIQQEWWFGVLILSMLAVPVLFVVAAVSVIV